MLKVEKNKSNNMHTQNVHIVYVLYIKIFTLLLMLCDKFIAFS